MPAHNPAALAEALGVAAELHVSTHYGISAWFDEYLKLYTQVRRKSTRLAVAQGATT